MDADWTATALAELCPPFPQQGNAFISLFCANFCTTSGTAIITKIFRVFKLWLKPTDRFKNITGKCRQKWGYCRSR